MLFAFVIVLFAGLAFMFLCLLRGQEKLAATLREELAATRARLEALERRVAPRAGEGQPAAPERPCQERPCQECPGADAPLLLPGDSLIPAAGTELPRTGSGAFSVREEAAAHSLEGRGETGGRAEHQPAEARRDDAERPALDRIPPERLAGERLPADRPPVDRLDMRPPSTPERDAARARDTGMPELKL